MKKRRLSGSRCTHNRNGLAFPYCEGDLFKNLVLSIVGERDAIKFDVPPDLPLLRGDGVRDLLIRVEKREDPFEGSHGRLENIVLLREIPDRLKKHPHVRQKGNQGSKGDRLLKHFSTSIPEEKADGPRAHHLHEGDEKGIDGNLLHVGQGNVLY